MARYKYVLSIVSHRQGELVAKLLQDLACLFSSNVNFKIIVTLNLPESESFLSKYEGKLDVIKNPSPLGFGANHNQAFARAESDFFVVINPDIRLKPSFLDAVLKDLPVNFGCVAPAVNSPEGVLMDNARKYPTTWRVFRRVLFRSRKPDYPTAIIASNPIKVDWVAGMFVVFSSQKFSALGGFDESYHMYLEDADICRRANRAGYAVLYDTRFSVIHDERRLSGRSLRHLMWHVRSMLRFLYNI